MKNKQSKIQKTINWAVIICEGSHIFCCVLPTLFSVVSVLVGAGMLATMPGWLDHFHDVMHDWEVPAIIFSGVVIAIGWGLDFVARRMHVHAEGCHHDHSDTDAKPKNLILKIATVLFLINVTVYFGLHRSHDEAAHVHDQNHEHTENHAH